MDILGPFRDAFDRAFVLDQDENFITHTKQLRDAQTLMFKYGFMIQLLFDVDDHAVQCHFEYNNPIVNQIEMMRLYTLCSALRKKMERLRQPYPMVKDS